MFKNARQQLGAEVKVAKERMAKAKMEKMEKAKWRRVRTGVGLLYEIVVEVRSQVGCF